MSNTIETDTTTEPPQMQKYAVAGKFEASYVHVVEAVNQTDAIAAFERIENPTEGWIEHSLKFRGAVVSDLPVTESPETSERRAANVASAARAHTRAIERGATASFAATVGQDLGIEWSTAGDAYRAKYIADTRVIFDAALPAVLGNGYTHHAAMAEIRRLRDLATSVIEERNEALSKVRAAERELPEQLRAERERTWAEAYPQGVEDQRIAAEVHDGQAAPKRENPHALPVPCTV